MRHGRFAASSALVGLVLVASVGAIDPGVSLIGFGVIPGTDLDKSGLAGQPICRIEDGNDCIDQATLGGFGSALAYTGFDHVFLTVPDRGPFDGRTDVSYRDRFHFMHFTLDLGAAFPNISARLLDTRFMKDHANRDFVGSSSDFEQRFDPEGAAVSATGTFFVSDEYGPFINEFNRQGHLIRRITLPARFLIENPSGDVDAGGSSLELFPALNAFGRQANRGMEGLTISPDGRYLFGLMQNALIQDNGLAPQTDPALAPGRLGVTARLLKIDLQTGATDEYVYVLDGISQGRGLNDIVAINGHQFLVVERDNRSLVPTPPNAAQTPNLKRIYKIDLTGATDVSGVDSLPASGAALAGLGITPVTKSLFVNLLDTSYVINGTPVRDLIAEKIEGLAFGPDLPDGRHVLYVVSDNDLYPGRPTQIYAFGVDPLRAGIELQRQQIAGPLFPPGQVRKALQ